MTKKKKAPPAAIDLNELVAAYEPLVKTLANRYAPRNDRGKRIEDDYDNLVQEGYVALFKLIPKCRDVELLPAFLNKRMPRIIKDFAIAEALWNKMSRPMDTGLLADTLPEGECAREREEAEWGSTLQRALNADELALGTALVDGYTQKEIAERLGCTQPCIAYRVKNLRKKLRPFLK